MRYNKINRNIRLLQLEYGPLQPLAQEQVPGATHVPPLLHPPLQIAI